MNLKLVIYVNGEFKSKYRSGNKKPDKLHIRLTKLWDLIVNQKLTKGPKGELLVILPPNYKGISRIIVLLFAPLQIYFRVLPNFLANYYKSQEKDRVVIQ